jgi:hypothetical protein
MRFRKKPVEIEAVETQAVLQAMHGQQPIESMPQWVRDAINDGTITDGGGQMLTALHINTLEGQMLSEYHCMIIRGVNGELYPCAPDIFAATYEAVSA